MRKCILLILFFIAITCQAVHAQDEGVLTKKARVTRGKSIYFLVGPSFRIGNNNGDYSGGFSLETGYLFRMNRMVSIGPSLFFSMFKYDDEISDSFRNSDATGNNIFIEDGGYEVKIVNMEGGDLTQIAAGLDVKIDFIPMADSRRFNVFGLVRPFLLVASRTAVSATVETWYKNVPEDPPSEWDYGGGPDELLNSDTDGLSRWGADTQFSGGLNLGVGVEYSLPSGLSFLVQGAFRVTLPITYIDTSAFEPSILTGYYHPDYPFVKKGFTTFNVSIGAVYRF